LRSNHLLGVVLWVSIAAAQKPPVPKTADGKPDLSGIWQGGGAAGLTFAIGADNAKAARPDAAPAQGGRGGGARPEPPPYQDWIQPKLKEIRDRRQIDDPSGRCLLVGVPRITSMPLPIKIVQTKDEVIFLYETFHAFRVIPTDGRGHPDDIDPSFMGDSVGRWEGDTLVVDVIGFNDKTWLGGGGASLHSDALHVVERYRRVDYDTITYNVFIEDPKVFTKSWNLAPSYLSLRPGERLREYECIADNQDIQRFEELLKTPAVFVRPPQ
jgi:hypothetical protein